MGQLLVSLLIPIILTVLILDVLPFIFKIKRNKIQNEAKENNEEQKISFDGPFKIAIRKTMRSRLAMVGLHILFILILWFMIGGLFLNDPYEIDPANRRYLPWGSDGYIFGTDQFGRCILARTVEGGKQTMYIAFMATAISLAIGLVMGSIAGFFGGKVDWVISRIIEIFVSIPFLVFCLVVSAIVVFDATPEQKVMYIILILGVLRWTGFARLIRGQVMQIRSMEYITATKALGISSKSTIVKHVIPGVMPYILIRFTLSMAFVTLTESSLSFLGFGVQPPTPTWGNMLTPARNIVILELYTWLWVPAAIVLLLTILSINIVGDVMTKSFDSKEDR